VGMNFCGVPTKDIYQDILIYWYHNEAVSHCALCFVSMHLKVVHKRKIDEFKSPQKSSFTVLYPCEHFNKDVLPNLK